MHKINVGQNGFANIVLVAIIVIIAGTVGYFAFVKKSVPIAQQTPSTPTSDTQTPTLTPTSSQIYENQYMKVNIPGGWTAKQATKTVYYGECINKENCTTTPKVELNPAAVNITKGNYILYINTQASQASGVIGGRFSEIAAGAPSADAVVTEYPNVCGTSETNSALPGHPRIDLYVGPKDKQPWCNVPSNKTVWFFSYIADKAAGGYFNYYVEGQGPTGYVITMAYNSKDVNNYPVKGSGILNSTLNEMTAIVKSLEIKQNKNIFVNNPYGLEFTMPSGYFVGSNDLGVTDASKAEAFSFSKGPINYGGTPTLDVSTNLEPTSGQNLNQFAQSIYLLNKDKNQVTTDLEQTSYGGAIAYEFGLQTAFTQPVGGQLLDLPGAKVVFLQHGRKTFKFLQTGADSGLTSILNSLKFK